MPSSQARVAATLEFLEARRRTSEWPATPPPPLLQQQSSQASAEVVNGCAEAKAAEDNGRGSASSDAVTAAFSRIYRLEEWGEEARSGLGSREGTTREFRGFLERFLRERGVTSVVDAGCGHWPSGYQRFMNWQGVHYTGIDVVPYVVGENRAYFADPAVLAARGLASARCQVGSVCDVLPGADLLLVKDVLMHLPNAAVSSFLRSSLGAQRPRYRMVMLVQNSVPPVVNLRQMIDIEPGQLLPFDITGPPFEAPFVDVFRWESDEPKVVQLWEAR